MDSFDIMKLTELQRLVYKSSSLIGHSSNGEILFQQEIHKYEKVITIISFLRALGMNLIENEGNEIVFERQASAQAAAQPTLNWANADGMMYPK